MNGRIYEHTSGFVGFNGSKVVDPKLLSSTTKKGINPDYISAGGQVLGQIITALGSVKDANLRRKYEQQINELNKIEQEKLNSQLLKAQNDSDRRKVFADVLSQLNKSRIDALNKPKTNIAIYIIGGVFILTATYLIYKKLMK